MNYALRTYANVGLETGVAAASPHKLVLMLYEGALTAVNGALTHMRAGNIARKGELISKAIQIIEEGLAISLDTNNGGDIALQLRQLYEYMSRRLLLASMHNEPAGLAEVAKLLTELKSAWEAISDDPSPGPSPSTATVTSATASAYGQTPSVKYGKA